MYEELVLDSSSTASFTNEAANNEVEKQHDQIDKNDNSSNINKYSSKTNLTLNNYKKDKLNTNKITHISHNSVLNSLFILTDDNKLVVYDYLIQLTNKISKFFFLY